MLTDPFAPTPHIPLDQIGTASIMELARRQQVLVACIGIHGAEELAAITAELQRRMDQQLAERKVFVKVAHAS